MTDIVHARDGLPTGAPARARPSGRPAAQIGERMDKPPRTDVGTLVLHWATAIAFVVSLFTGKKTAFMVSGPWQFADLNKSGIKYDVSPVPGFAGGKPASPFITVDAAYVASKGKNKTLAQEFVTNYWSRADVAQALFKANRRLNKAYLLKEMFSQLWEYKREVWARRFFERWKSALRWQRLKPYGKFARMVEVHWDGIASYCHEENKVPLGFVEGINNKIRVIQRRAYGLRDEEYLRLKILTCMLPEI